MSATDGNGHTLTYRVGRNEDSIKSLQRASRTWDRNDDQINGAYGINKRLDDLTELIEKSDQRSEARDKVITRILITVGIGVIMSAVGFALNVLQAGGV